MSFLYLESKDGTKGVEFLMNQAESLYVLSQATIRNARHDTFKLLQIGAMAYDTWMPLMVSP